MESKIRRVGMICQQPVPGQCGDHDLAKDYSRHGASFPCLELEIKTPSLGLMCKELQENL